jgi:hypothetical protein
MHQGGLILFILDENTTTWLKTGDDQFFFFLGGGGKPTVVSVSHKPVKMIVRYYIAFGKRQSGDPGRGIGTGERRREADSSVRRLGERRKLGRLLGGSHDILDQKISKEMSDNRCLLIGVCVGRPTVPAREEREHEELVVKPEGYQFDDCPHVSKRIDCSTFNPCHLS